MGRMACRIVGVGLLAVGLAGFALPTVLGLHLTTVHNVIHLITGLLALYAGFAGTRTTARFFCLFFGAAYLLLGLAGLVAPGLVSEVLGHAPVSSRELTPDNAFHAVLGATLLAASKKP